MYWTEIHICVIIVVGSSPSIGLYLISFVFQNLDLRKDRTMNALQETPEVTLEELQQTMDGIYGLMRCIPQASDLLGLSMCQVGIFCRNTPGGKKGEELWREFTSRRNAKPDGTYNFTHFMEEVLAEAGHTIHM
jgi:hypothetical protein